MLFELIFVVVYVELNVEKLQQTFQHSTHTVTGSIQSDNIRITRIVSASFGTSLLSHYLLSNQIKFINTQQQIKLAQVKKKQNEQYEDIKGRSMS